MLPLKLPTSLCVLVLLPAAACFASALEDQDNAPVSGIYNFVDSTEGAELLPKGSVAWTLVAMTSSHAVAERSGNEALVFDGETTRTEFRLRYAVSDELELGIEIPYLWHSPGELDQFIDAWHDTFGLPGGSRRRFAARICLSSATVTPTALRSTFARASRVSAMPG
jgi:hypothetical protein